MVPGGGFGARGGASTGSVAGSSRLSWARPVRGIVLIVTKMFLKSLRG